MHVKEFLKKFCPPSARTFHSAQEKISSAQQDIQNRLFESCDILTQLSTDTSASLDILARLSAGMSDEHDAFAQLSAGMSDGREALARLSAGLSDGREALAQLSAGMSDGREALARLSAEVSGVRDALAQLSAEVAANRDILKQLSIEKRQYNNQFEYDYLQTHGFFQAVTSGDLMYRYMRLVDGLDEESIETVNRILTRIQIMEKSRALPLDIYNDEEKKMFTFLEKEFPREVLKVSDNCYAYKQYRLPVNHFEPCVFFDKHGITQLSANRNRMIQGDIIDAGGFIGDSVLVLSPLTGGKVYTFEPVRENFDLMQKTMELNHITNAVCEKAALGRQSGTAAFAVQNFCSYRTDSMDEGTEKVPVITLDEYVREHPLQVGLIKSDLEGMEQDFLLGAKETITTQKPVLLLSMYHNDRDFFGLKPLLESWDVGYHFKVFKGLDYGICLETMLIAEVY